MENGRVVGIGGIFFKSKDADAAPLRDWYRDKLGVDYGKHGAMFPWRSVEAPNAEHVTVWSIFPGSSKYYDAPFMINYIVEGMDPLLERLTAGGVQVLKREDSEYGRFAWILDADGNKVELWEPPVDSAQG